MSGFPTRIVCLTEETTETLYRLGEGHRVVGISGYTVRPPEARQKPKVSAYLSAKFDKIEALNPDLVLAFSDLQADITGELIKRGRTVLTFNQRSVCDILQMIRMVGGLVGCAEKAEQLIDELNRGLDLIRESASRFRVRPRVFFEEWDDPLISGICWVDELIEIAGGQPMYPELRTCKLARDRVLNPQAVALNDPEIVIASWCGRAVNKRAIVERDEWSAVTAVKNGHLFEVKSTYILQPGPASLTEGVRQVHAIIATVLGAPIDPSIAPEERWDSHGLAPKAQSPKPT